MGTGGCKDGCPPFRELGASGRVEVRWVRDGEVVVGEPGDAFDCEDRYVSGLGEEEQGIGAEIRRGEGGGLAHEVPGGAADDEKVISAKTAGPGGK